MWCLLLWRSHVQVLIEKRVALGTNRSKCENVGRDMQYGMKSFSEGTVSFDSFKWKVLFHVRNRSAEFLFRKMEIFSTRAGLVVENGFGP